MFSIIPKKCMLMLDRKQLKMIKCDLNWKQMIYSESTWFNVFQLD